MKYPASTVVCLLLASGCAEAPGSDSAQSSLEWGQRLTEARRVNENWSADCTRDQVTSVRRCFAGAFMQSGAPFQVYFLDQRGPYVMAGLHTFPGRQPQIRFDYDPRPMIVSDDGGVSGNSPDPAIVERMLRGVGSANVRYHSWPEGARDDTVTLTGFDQAWARLQALVRGQPAPGESLPPPSAGARGL